MKMTESQFNALLAFHNRMLKYFTSAKNEIRVKETESVISKLTGMHPEFCK